VRNLPDGRVEILIQGTQDQVDALIKWCYRGPEEARVSDIRIAFEAISEDFADFGIR
jgi:acylphosphatase